MGVDNGPLVGTWKLTSRFMEDVQTRGRNTFWGEHPNGYLVLTPGGRWIVIQTAEERKEPRTDEDQAAAFRSLIAYSGKYHTEGPKIMINVDIAWDESWRNTEQVRYYRIEGGRLYIETAPRLYPLGDNLNRGVLVWTRD